MTLHVHSSSKRFDLQVQFVQFFYHLNETFSVRSVLQLLVVGLGVKMDERLVRAGLIVASLRRFRQGSSVIVWELSKWWPGGKKICTFAFPRNAPVAQRILCEVWLRTRGSAAFVLTDFKPCVSVFFLIWETLCATEASKESAASTYSVKKHFTFVVLKTHRSQTSKSCNPLSC